MEYQTLYARRVPTFDTVLRDAILQGWCTVKMDNVDACKPPHYDVQLLNDAGKQVALYPWYKHKPTKRNLYWMLNCWKYKLEWLPQATLKEALAAQ